MRTEVILSEKKMLVRELESNQLRKWPTYGSAAMSAKLTPLDPETLDVA